MIEPSSDINLRVADVGEQGVLAIVQRFCPPEIIGDDAALLNITPDQQLVVTTDVLVDGVHFSDRTTPPEAIGWRATTANLSDLAAMGALPLGITVGLSLPGNITLDWVKRLYQGISDCLQLYDTPLVGGDVCRSPVITIAITAFGQVPCDRAIKRNQAQVGDAIIVTGYHGDSKAGLELLLNPELGINLTEKERKYLINAHQYPLPRLDITHKLRQIDNLPNIAGMDSSDGLADAIIQICRSSNVGAIIERQQIPLSPALSQLVEPEQALNWSLYGGEDFELVLVVPQDFTQILLSQLGDTATIIGNITSNQKVILTDDCNPPLVLTMKAAFQHFDGGV